MLTERERSKSVSDEPQKRHRERLVRTAEPFVCGHRWVWRRRNDSCLEDGNPWPVNLGYHDHEKTSFEYCIDEVHPQHPYQGGSFDKFECINGGISLKGSPTFSYTNSVSDDKNYKRKYVGRFFCKYGPQDNVLDLDKFSWTFGKTKGADEAFGNITDWGPTAWKRFRPGKPGAQLAVSIAELSDVTRMLKTSALAFRDLYKAWKSGQKIRKGLKTAANNHLNNQFGWLPFVSDIRGLYNLYHDMDSRLQQLIRDNGNWIRRKGVVYHDKPTSNVVYTDEQNTAHWPKMSKDWGVASPNGRHTVKVSSEQQVWFSGKFRYYIPNIESVAWDPAAKARLFGLYVTPETIWELVPFSWLVDYFANVGDVLANLDDGMADNLAAKYAYVMGTTRKWATVESTLKFRNGAQHHAAWDYDVVRKSRVQASPFGFHLTGAELSARQLSILTALGLSRFL